MDECARDRCARSASREKLSDILGNNAHLIEPEAFTTLINLIGPLRLDLDAEDAAFGSKLRALKDGVASSEADIDLDGSRSREELFEIDAPFGRPWSEFSVPDGLRCFAHALDVAELRQVSNQTRGAGSPLLLARMR